MDQNQIDIFFKKSSYAGLLILYAAKLSFDRQQAFDIEKFSKQISEAVGGYFQGFLVACSSIGLIEFNEKDLIVTITYINPILSERIKKELVQMASLKSSSQLWRDWVAKTEAYFG